jgi:hypothetical protein
MSDETQVVHDGERHGSLLPYNAGRLASTFSLSTPAGKVKLHNALHGDKAILKSQVGKTLHIADIVSGPREKTLPTGETDEWQEVVLICTDGKQYTTSSPYVASGLASMMMLFGLPPWPGGMGVVVRSRPTTAGKEMLYLECAAPKDEPPIDPNPADPF